MCYRAQLSYLVLNRTYEAYDKYAVLLLFFFSVIWWDVNEQQVLLYNAHLGLMKVSLWKTLDSMPLVTLYMKFDSSGTKFTETAPVQHVSPTNDEHVQLKT